MIKLNLPRLDAWIVLLFLLLSTTFVGLHVKGYTALSPVDELQHIDYLYQIPDHPDPEDKVGQQALHQQICRGVDSPGMEAAGCRSGYLDPDVFQERGYNTAAGYTPVYYALTRGVAEVIEIATPADDLVTAGRVTGALWLTLGVSLIYFAGRLRGIGRLPLGATLALMIASPALIYPSSTIAPDGAALASGGLLMLCLTRWELHPSRSRTLALILVGILVGAVKMTYLIAVAAVCLYLLVRWARGRVRTQVPALTPVPALTRVPALTPVIAVATGVAAVAASFAWTAYMATKPQVPANDLPDMATRFAVQGFPWDGLGESLLVLITPLSSPWVAVGSLQLTLIVTSVVSTVLTAGLVAAAVFGVTDEAERDLARATLLGGLIGAAGLVAMAYLTTGSYIPLPSRYGMALVAPIAITTAACIRTRASATIVATLAAVTLVLTLWRLIALQ